MLELMFNGGVASSNKTLINGQHVISSIAIINGSWTVPADVFEISMVIVGAGGVRGRGGDLRWIKQVRVTPGEILTIALGGNSDTVISRGSTDILRARYGRSTNSSTPISLPDVGGGNGGTVGSFGGGGAGGYSGNGGDGYSNGSAKNGLGGGGGGGGSWYYNGTRWGGGGGGVGLLGPGANGIAGVITSSAPTTANYGGGGSGGANGQGASGGNYGGSASATSGVTIGAAAIRIIWGPGRAYPSTKTADMS